MQKSYVIKKIILVSNKILKIKKIVTFLIITALGLSLFLTAPMVFSQEDSLPENPKDESKVIYIPPEQLRFSPAKEEDVDINKTDISVAVLSYPELGEVTECAFEVRFVTANGEESENEQFLDNTETLEDEICQVSVASPEYEITDYKITVRVKNEAGEVFGSDFSYLGQEKIEPEKLVDGEDVEVPKQLYLEPKITIVADKEEYEVGDEGLLTVGIENRDNFVLKDFEFRSEISDNLAEYDCNSPDLRDIEILRVDRCQKSSLDLTLLELKPGEKTELNLDVGIKKKGRLEVNYTTNLDQKNIAKTIPINQIRPNQARELQVEPTFFERNERYIWLATLLLLVILAFVAVKKYLLDDKSSSEVRPF